MNLVLALDQGTTSSRSILFDLSGAIRGVAQKEFTQHFPKPGWVEHDPEELWRSQLVTIRQLLKPQKKIVALGISNQRETTVLWDKHTGLPLANAIVWQDRRTAAMCDRLKTDGAAALINRKTGLEVDAYFSATKIAWLLDRVKGARKLAIQGRLACGTIDSWLVWKLTRGRLHVTDFSNASRTMLFNIRTGAWDAELCRMLKIPPEILPSVVSSSGFIGECEIPELKGVPIAGIAGDQQAALFGQLCVRGGSSKNTYGTGCFMLMNTGTTIVKSRNRLLSTIAWKLGTEPLTYALEGGVFVGGALVQWLRDELGIVKRSSDISTLARSVKDSAGVCIVPAFAGLGAPYWDQYARGTIIGLTRGTNKAHLARAAEEAIALQVVELVQAMEKDSHLRLKELRVDGGGANDDLLLQIQSDLLGIPVSRSKVIETTALGAAYLAGLGVGVWKTTRQLSKNWKAGKTFEPRATSYNAELKERWQRAVERSRNWQRSEDYPR